MYAAGKIPGGFFKREGRPTETAHPDRAADRPPAAPAVPQGLPQRDAGHQITVLSIDHGERSRRPGDHRRVGGAVHLRHPVRRAGRRACASAMIDGEFVVNPHLQEMAAAGSTWWWPAPRDAVLMVEAGARRADRRGDARRRSSSATAASKQLIELQEQLIAAAGQAQARVSPAKADTHLVDRVRESAGRPAASEAVYNRDKATPRSADRRGARRSHRPLHRGRSRGRAPASVVTAVGKAFDALLKERCATPSSTRACAPTGAAPDEIRADHGRGRACCPASTAPGLFTRGQTQVLTVATLGTGATSSGWTVWASRRQALHAPLQLPALQHGRGRALRGPAAANRPRRAGRARAAGRCCPPRTSSPTRCALVARCSRRTARPRWRSVCGGSLALMDAGVPIKAPVAGIAMGLITAGRRRTPGADRHPGHRGPPGRHGLQGGRHRRGHHRPADGHQDPPASPTRSCSEALRAGARRARLFILDKMNDVIAEPRAELSLYAPRITSIRSTPRRSAR